MDDEWLGSDEEPSFETAEHHAEEAEETLESYEINAEVISDTLRRLCQKAGNQKPGKDSIDDIEDLGFSIKKFIQENLRILDYRDMAELIGIKPDELKRVLVKGGITVPVEGSRRWKDIPVGTFSSLANCARCQVQGEHNTFLVGINDCRSCYEKNIAYWIEEGETINIRFPEED